MTEQRSGTFFVKGEKIVLKKDSTWMADGIEITHDQTRELFYRAIHWDEKEKKFCLKVGYETIFIEVEDTPYFVLAVETGKAGAPSALLTDGRSLPITARALSYESTGNGALYLTLPDGLRAKFLSAPYYELLKALEEDDDHYFLVLAGKRVNLAPSGAPINRGRPSGKGP